jgi:hypothetical protein
MSLTPAQIAALKTELTTDPRGYGYNAAARNDTDLANRVNLVRDGSAGTVPTTPTADGGAANGAVTLKRPDCKPSEILEAIDVRDLLASPAGVTSVPLTQSWFESITQFATIRLTNQDGSKTQVRKNIDRITGNTNLSQDRLDAVAVRFGSRAEEKFGFGVAVTIDDVGKALN